MSEMSATHIRWLNALPEKYRNEYRRLLRRFQDKDHKYVRGLVNEQMRIDAARAQNKERYKGATWDIRDGKLVLYM